MKNNLVSWEQIIILSESPIMEMHFAHLSRDKIIDTINATARRPNLTFTAATFQGWC